MKFSIPDLCFLTSSIPLRFDTDGYVTLLEQDVIKAFGLGHIMILTHIHVQMVDFMSVKGVSLFDTIEVPNGFKIPEIYDGTQNLGGKRILILMLNGWGDMILIQPALHVFYENAITSSFTN